MISTFFPFFFQCIKLTLFHHTELYTCPPHCSNTCSPRWFLHCYTSLLSMIDHQSAHNTCPPQCYIHMSRKLLFVFSSTIFYYTGPTQFHYSAPHTCKTNCYLYCAITLHCYIFHHIFIHQFLLHFSSLLYITLLLTLVKQIALKIQTTMISNLLSHPDINSNPPPYHTIPYCLTHLFTNFSDFST